MKTRRTIDQMLAEHPFFQGLAPEQLQLIAGCAQNAHFKADTYLFHEGEPASTFYILRSGKVALEINIPGPGMVIIETFNAGEVFGWSWLFPTWHFSTRAVEDIQVTAFDGVCLRGKAEQNHALGYPLTIKFAEVMMQRLQATRLRLLDLHGMRNETSASEQYMRRTYRRSIVERKVREEQEGKKRAFQN